MELTHEENGSESLVSDGPLRDEIENKNEIKIPYTQLNKSNYKTF